MEGQIIENTAASQPKKQRIKNKHYRQFLDTGEIELITEDNLKAALNNITKVRGHSIQESRALLIALYYTGARPVEVLNIRGKDINKQGRYVTIVVKGFKRGLPRTVYLPYKNPLVQEVLNLSLQTYPDLFIFYRFRSKTHRTRQTKKGIVGYVEVSNKLQYHVNKWFKGVLPDSIPPYYLRHNRFSKLAAAGASLEQLRLLKGSRTFSSITPYVHLSSAEAKKLARKIE